MSIRASFTYVRRHSNELLILTALGSLLPLANCGSSPTGGYEADTADTADTSDTSDTDPTSSGGGDASGGAPGAGGASGGATGSGGMDAGGAGGTGGTGGVLGKIIYLTSTPTSNAVFGGVTGADAACNASPPNGESYKALIVDGSTRVACTTPNCGGGMSEHVDWVLAPDTLYSRPDGTAIGTTSAAGIFEFPLDASVSTNGGFAYWTGLEADWTSNEHCAGWTGTTGEFADQGLDNETSSAAIQGTSVNCGALAGAFFACVEQ